MGNISSQAEPEAKPDPNPLKLPETVVLSILIHGAIIYSDASPPTFSSQIDVVRVSAVETGVCNIMTDRPARLRRKMILDEIRKAPPTNTVQLVELANHISDTLKPEHHELDTDVSQDDPHLKPYLHRFGNRYEVGVFLKGSPMLDKSYSRTSADFQQHYDLSDLHQIAVMPMEGNATVDLMPYVQTTNSNDEKQYTTLSAIVNVLKGMGVKRVLILDFSCSSIYKRHHDKGDYYEPSEREVRYDRRDLKRSRFGGRKRTSTRKRSKSKKNTH